MSRLRRGVRRLAAALTKDPLKFYDATENFGVRWLAVAFVLDGFAVKKKARVSLTLPSRTPKNVTISQLSTPNSLTQLLTPHSSLLTRLRRNNTTIPSAISAHADGSGTAEFLIAPI